MMVEIKYGIIIIAVLLLSIAGLLYCTNFKVGTAVHDPIVGTWTFGPANLTFYDNHTFDTNWGAPFETGTWTNRGNIYDLRAGNQSAEYTYDFNSKSLNGVFHKKV